MKINVIESDELLRIDKYLTNKTKMNRSTITKLFNDNKIKVNGNIVKPSYKVLVGDIIEYEEYIPKPLSLEKQDVDFEIIYEDDYLIIVNKPSGLVVHPGSGNYDQTLVNGLLKHTDSLSDVNNNYRPGIVHRLDKDTSGLLVVAKDNITHELLSQMFSKRTIKKEYIALLIGEFKPDTALIDAPIGRDEKSRKKMSVTSKNSKEALTHLTVLKRYKGYTLVKLNLETGRTHQIRVHMKYIGYPIYNDPVYTSEKATAFGQFLHSSNLEFIHPITKERVSFEADLPNEFKEFINSLEIL